MGPRRGQQKNFSELADQPLKRESAFFDKTFRSDENDPFRLSRLSPSRVRMLPNIVHCGGCQRIVHEHQPDDRPDAGVLLQ
jgi:hypothetical protein